MAKKKNNPIDAVRKKAASVKKPPVPGRKKNTPKKAAGKKASSAKNGISRKARKRILIGTWVVVFFPFLMLGLMMLTIPAEEIPDYALLENPVSNQASTVYSSDQKILGTYFIDNRSNVGHAVFV